MELDFKRTLWEGSKVLHTSTPHKENPSVGQVLITHCAWQRVSLAARTSTEHRTGIPKETRMSQAERKRYTCRAGHAGRLGDPA